MATRALHRRLAPPRELGGQALPDADPSMVHARIRLGMRNGFGTGQFDRCDIGATPIRASPRPRLGWHTPTESAPSCAIRPILILTCRITSIGLKALVDKTFRSYPLVRNRWHEVIQGSFRQTGRVGVLWCRGRGRAG